MSAIKGVVFGLEEVGLGRKHEGWCEQGGRDLPYKVIFVCKSDCH